MKTPCAAITSFALAAVVGLVAADCDPNLCPMDSYGQYDMYCQPWSPEISNCQPKPAQCRFVHTGYAVDAPPIASFYGITPGDCCTMCINNDECAAFTFINYRQGSPACYLSRNGVRVKAQKEAILVECK